MKKVKTILLALCLLALCLVAAAQTAPAAPTVPEGFVRVEGGTFLMGSNDPNSFDREKPVHSVTVSSFSIAKYELTQKEWVAVMGTTLRQQWEIAADMLSLLGEGDNYPMRYVSWNEAVEYCNRRSQKEGLTPAYRNSNGEIVCDFTANGYRLPTEAEWEFAAKGGNKSFVEYTYSGSNNAEFVAWYADNSGEVTHPVGTKAPNSLGIYDMSGNVKEWCGDWYEDYSSEAQTDPTGGVSSELFRVTRGGGWHDGTWNVSSAYRGIELPTYRSDSQGFRLVRP